MDSRTRVLFARGASLEALSEAIASMLSGYAPEDVLHLSHTVHTSSSAVQPHVYTAIVLVRVAEVPRARRAFRARGEEAPRS